MLCWTRATFITVVEATATCASFLIYGPPHHCATFSEKIYFPPCHKKIAQLSRIFKKFSPIKCLLNVPVSCLSHFSCLMSYVYCLLYHVSCIISLVLCLLSYVSCLLYHVFCIISLVSCLMSPVSCIMSHVSSRFKHIQQIIGQFFMLNMDYKDETLRD